MKKTHLAILTLLATTSIMGQKNLINLSESINKGLVTSDKQITNTISAEKSGGVVVWSDDFSNPATWTIDNDTMSAAGYGWDINSSVDSWFFSSAINSTSGGNFAELNNGDPTSGTGTQALGVTYSITTATPIDINALAGTDQVSLQFQQFGARFNDLQQILISTNGVTFDPIGDNSDKDVLSSAGGSAYNNPDVKLINLAPYISGGFSSSVWIRFQWTTAYPNSASNPNVWITYGWMIDDVEIVTNPNNDLTIMNHYFGSLGIPYYQIPIDQITPIDFSANVMNNGASDQPNTILSVDFGGGLSVSSNPSTIAVGATDSLFTTQHTPNASLGAINTTWTVYSDSVDDNSNDNSVSEVIEITDYVYARDKGVIDGGSFNSGEPYEVGNYFDIIANQTVKAIDITISSSTEPGAIVYGVIYSIDAATGDFIFEGNTADYITTNTDVSNQATVTLPLFSPITLTGGKAYLAIAGAYGDGGTTNDIVIATSGDSEPQTSFYYDGVDLTWYYTTSTPMVRLNFDPFISIQERSNTKAFLSQNMPNPFNENTKIVIELDEQKEITFEIFDITGKVVKHLDLGSMGMGRHELNINADGFRNGIYYYSIFNEEFKITKKMVLQK